MYVLGVILWLPLPLGKGPALVRTQAQAQVTEETSELVKPAVRADLASRGQQRPARRAQGGALPLWAAFSSLAEGGLWIVPLGDLFQGVSPYLA